VTWAPARLAAAAWLVLAPAAAGMADEPKDTIKKASLEIKRVPYRSEGRPDPFRMQAPLRTILQRDPWKVRVGSLSLSSVVVGRRRVAVFRDTFGMDYAYLLVDGVLLGPDHKPIPGVAGSIEPGEQRGEYRVTLKQGGERVVHDFKEGDAVRKRWQEEQEAAGESRSGEAGRRRGGADGSVSPRYADQGWRE
jgi:hypothetical protein